MIRFFWVCIQAARHTYWLCVNLHCGLTDFTYPYATKTDAPRGDIEQWFSKAYSLCTCTCLSLIFTPSWLWQVSSCQYGHFSSLVTDVCESASRICIVSRLVAIEWRWLNSGYCRGWNPCSCSIMRQKESRGAWNLGLLLYRIYKVFLRIGCATKKFQIFLSL